MPTKKKRVGFIPRSDVFDIINKLSIESNLSISKVINMLVEEALYKRGVFNMKTGKAFDESYRSILDYSYPSTKVTFNKKSPFDFKRNFLDNADLNSKDIEEEVLDREIYSKFLLFLEFQEKMKKRE